MTRIADIDLLDPISIASHKKVIEAAMLMDKHGVGSILILAGEGRLTAVMTERDIVRGIARHGVDYSHQRIEDVILHAPITIHSERSVADAARMMARHKIRHLPVVDGEHLRGLLSIRALLPFIKDDAPFDFQE